MTPDEIARTLNEHERASVRYLTGEWRRFNKASHLSFRREHGLATWRPSDHFGAIDFKLTPRGVAVKRALARIEARSGETQSGSTRRAKAGLAPNSIVGNPTP